MVPSKRQRRWLPRTSAGIAVLSALLLALPPARAETADSAPVDLQLEVRLNGYPLNLISAFALMPDGHVASPRSELTEIGVAVPGTGAPEELIVLDTISGLSYVYDESSQSIAIEVGEKSRIARDLKATPEGEIVTAQSGTGLVLNYTAYAAANYEVPASTAAMDGASLSLDARAFSRFGTLRQSGILGTTTFANFTALRLDTTWSYSDQASMRTYRLGDIISGGLGWTRPVRMGGAQVQRNFGLRPDLITIPLPNVGGTAAVPSTLDVFIGDVRAYSGQIDPGPFTINDIPVFTSSGTARMVLTDSTGRAVESETDFFTSPDLLKHDLFDFSADVGVVRRDYGSESFGYDDEPVGLASVRYGISDAVTGEAHVEAMSDLLDIGIGGLVSGRRLGMFSAAAAASLHDGETGLFLYGGWEGHFGNLSLQASSSRTFGKYFDIAAVTEKPLGSEPFTTGVPRAIDQFSLGYSFPAIKAGAGLSFVHQEQADGERTYLFSASYSQSFENDLSLFLTGYADLGGSGDFGAYAGFSMPLGVHTSSSAGVSAAGKSWTAFAEASRPFGDKPGDYGWRVGHGEGETRFTSASGAYRTNAGVVEGMVSQQNSSVAGNAAFTGAAVVAGKGLFFGNHIDDAFAVVDAGVPGVKVSYENRFAGTTGANGKLLLPGLHSYQKNKVAIDVTDLPLAASVAESEVNVVPGEAAGVVVDFGVAADAAGALVTLTGADGQPVATGAEVTMNDGGETFLVGYDGEVYVTGALARNTLSVKGGGKQCRAEFDFAPSGGGQTAIGPIQCL